MSDTSVHPLNVTDLRSVLSIINVCSSRGVFRPDEMENVGRLYNKLNKFVDSVSVNEKVEEPLSGEDKPVVDKPVVDKPVVNNI